MSTDVTVTVSTALTGPQGPAGSLSLFTFSQSSASTTWNITHTGTIRPLLIAVDLTDTQMADGVISYTDNTHVRIVFPTARAGKAYLYI